MKISFAFVLFQLLFSNSLIAQSDIEDIKKLKSELLQSNSDEGKLNALSTLGEALLIQNPTEALIYSEQLTALASKKEDHQWITTALYLEGRVNFALGNNNEADAIFEKALNYEVNSDPIDKTKLAWVEVNYGNHLKKTGRYLDAIQHFKHGLVVSMEIDNKAIQADCLGNIGAMFLYVGEMDSAEHYFEPAKLLAYEIHDTSSLQTISNNMANVYEAKGEYDKALEELEIAEFLSHEDVDLAYVYGTRGTIYYYQGKIDSALTSIDKSIYYFKKIGRELEEGMLVNMLGEILKDNGDYDRAKQEFNHAAEIFTRLGNEDFLTGVYMNMAGLYKDEGIQDSSYSYYQKGLELALKADNANHIGIAYQNLGLIDEDRGDLRSAAIQIERSLSIFETIGDKRLIAESRYALSGIYLKMKSYQKAKMNAEAALISAEEIGHIKLQIKSYDRFIEVFAKLSKPELYDYHQKQIGLLDSLRSIDNSNAANELSVTYDLKEKEDSIQNQTIELKNQQAVNEKISIINEQRGSLLLLSSIGGAILLGLLALLLISRKKVKAKNAENELLLGEIHHRVKNNLQVISSLLSLQEKSITDVTAKKAILEGKERVKSMGLIHKMLYQNDNFSGIEMTDYISNLIEGLMESFGMSSSELDLDTEFDAIRLDVDSAIPIGLIINELVINTFKYAFTKTDHPKISVKLFQEEKGLMLAISDNGDGKVSEIDRSDSFGYKLVKSLVRQLNGELSMDDKKGLSYHILIKEYKLV